MRKLCLSIALLLFVTSAQAGITLVSGTGAVNPGQASATTATCTLGAAVAAGDLIVVFGIIQTNRTVNKIEDGSANAYTIDRDTVALSPTSRFGQIGSRVAAGSETPTITITYNTGTNGGAELACAGFNSSTGWPASGPNRFHTYDVGGATTGVTSVALTTGLVTTGGQAEELLLSFVNLNATKDVTVQSGSPTFARATPAGTAEDHMEYAVTSSTGTYAAGFTWTGTTTARLIGAAYKNTAAAGGGAKRRSGGIY